MTTFTKLKKLKVAMAHMPGIHTCKDFDIVVEIGAHQETGNPLTLKQLLLLDVASAATVRRHLSRLIADNLVIKQTSHNDHRIVQLILSEAAISSLHQYVQTISLLFQHPNSPSPGHPHGSVAETTTV